MHSRPIPGGILPAGFIPGLRDHLKNDILSWWPLHAVDRVRGGFFGRIDNDATVYQDEPRSIVMTARFLWTYSAAARFFHDASLLDTAHHAFRAIRDQYLDREEGGVFWSVNPDGSAYETRKQLYGQAFAVYGLSEFSAALRELYPTPSGEIAGYSAMAMKTALDVYRLMEEHAKDRVYGGYFEALGKDWGPIADRRLSEKDIDCDKSMNTNLHVMEALANLYRTLSAVSPERDAVRDSLRDLVETLCTRIVLPSFHLGLYFNDDWAVIPAPVSFGHDIEASWLIHETLALLDIPELTVRYLPIVESMAATAIAEAHDPASGLFFNERHDGIVDRTSVWWTQAEAVTGFCNAWTLTGELKYLEAMVKTWQWIQTRQIDRDHGEWFSELDTAGLPRQGEAKGGNWKTAYHNGRCIIEVLKRLS